jgi:ribosomal protein L11 methyltransferase
MFSIDVNCTQADKDLTIAELWEAGSTGIVELEDSETASRMRAFFDDDAIQAALAERYGTETQPADNRDWVAFAHEHLQPMKIGNRIFVVPEWRDDATPEGRIRIVTNAGLAFGTGAHETTRLCLQALERRIKPGVTVVDVGCGSGILSEAALKLGAGRVFACDTDPEAIAAARENFARAGVPIPLLTGSADAFAGNSADLILANISPAWVRDLADEWVRVLKPKGVAILSGFEEDDVPAIA